MNLYLDFGTIVKAKVKSTTMTIQWVNFLNSNLYARAWWSIAQGIKSWATHKHIMRARSVPTLRKNKFIWLCNSFTEWKMRARRTMLGPTSLWHNVNISNGNMWKRKLVYKIEAAHTLRTRSAQSLAQCVASNIRNPSAKIVRPSLGVRSGHWYVKPDLTRQWSDRSLTPW